MSTLNHVLKSKVKLLEDKIGTHSDTENLRDLFNQILDKTRHLPAVQTHIDEQSKQEQRQTDEGTRRKTTTKTR
jgi:CO dehydrogenase/acetyl-CoA synthase beta subunit